MRTAGCEGRAALCEDEHVECVVRVGCECVVRAVCVYEVRAGGADAGYAVKVVCVVGEERVEGVVTVWGGGTVP